MKAKTSYKFHLESRCFGKGFELNIWKAPNIPDRWYLNLKAVNGQKGRIAGHIIVDLEQIMLNLLLRINLPDQLKLINHQC